MRWYCPTTWFFTAEIFEIEVLKKSKIVVQKICAKWFGYKISDHIGFHKDVVINQRKLMFAPGYQKLEEKQTNLAEHFS